jgi:hypothetical protein
MKVTALTGIEAVVTGTPVARVQPQTVCSYRGPLEFEDVGVHGSCWRCPPE